MPGTATLSDDASASFPVWREELATRVARAFLAAYLLATPLLVVTLQGAWTRVILVAVSLSCAALIALPMANTRSPL